MTTWHARGTLGLRPENTNHLSLRTAADRHAQIGITVHHTGYGGTLYKPDPIARLRGIQAYHMDTLGYGDIAYEFGFDAQANVYGLRDMKYVGAHALGTKRGGGIPNRLTVGLVYLEDSQRWTTGASQALAWVCDVYHLDQGRIAHLFAHEYWSFTECPGDYIVNVVKFTGGSA